MSLAESMQSYLADVDSTMRHFVSLLPEETPGFGLMLRYALGWSDEQDKPYKQQTGKRIRPVLLLLSAEAAGGTAKSALPAAAAVELLHNFSLIHDDIQDESPIRHNRPTVWQVWGRANAINAGDVMFTLAYTALENLAEHRVPLKTVVKVWQIFNQTNLELTRGQHLDMRFEGQKTVSVDDYISMITGKSAALIAGAAQMGALIGSHDEAVARHYADFGLNLGIAFQIRDDVLGIWGDPAVTGKSAATDIISRKKSLPVLHGLSKSPALRKIYSKASFSDADVQTSVALLTESGAKGYTESMEAAYFQQALHALESAQPREKAAENLMELVNFLFERQY